jgi:hypothetical protein
MNPWSLYQHKPQLVQAVGVGAVAWLARRRGASPSLVVTAALSWALLGVLDWLVYAFGYQFARLTADAVVSVQRALEWLRVLVVLLGAFALLDHRKRPPA